MAQQLKRLQRKLARSRRAAPARALAKPAEQARAGLAEALGYPLQTKLTVGAPDDAHEREADAVADRVMAAPQGRLQRQCENCADEEKKKKPEEHDDKRRDEEVQRKPAAGAAGRSGDGADAALPAGGGQGLPAAERSFFEPRLATDLAGVRIHADASAAQLAARLAARAFTTGSDVYFAAGEYRPGTREGRHLLAHELTHVLQQRGATQPAGQTLVQRFAMVVGQPYDRLSDDGKMAVKGHGKEGWAEPANIAKSNAVLDGLKSKAKIEELAAGGVKVSPPGKAVQYDLKKFRMIHRVGGGELDLTDDCGTANQQVLGAEAAGYKSFVGVTKRGTTEEYTSPSSYRADDNAKGGLVSTTEQMSGEIYVRIFDREFKKTLTRENALKEWDKLSAAEKKRLSKKYGINRYAVPKVGQGITMGSERDMPGASESGYNFHFGFNLMASGNDYVTLEDYASSGVKYYLDMYGPASKSQSWADNPGNTGAMDDKTTTMVVQHPESLNGTINAEGVHFEADPAAPTGLKKLAKGTKVTILRKGQFWTKVEVKSGPSLGQSGWIGNQYFSTN